MLRPYYFCRFLTTNLKNLIAESSESSSNNLVIKLLPKVYMQDMIIIFIFSRAFKYVSNYYICSIKKTIRNLLFVLQHRDRPGVPNLEI